MGCYYKDKNQIAYNTNGCNFIRNGFSHSQIHWSLRISRN